MSQRDSGYVRVEREKYETPSWVTHALAAHIPAYVCLIWEPACGSGKMERALITADFGVHGTDIETGTDFLTHDGNGIEYQAIITNPPYSLARKFIEHALELTRPSGAVAMLLACDFDHGKTRRHLFNDCPAWSKKIILTKRIVWFKPPPGKKAGPSSNHAWYIWDWNHKGPPTLAYIL